MKCKLCSNDVNIEEVLSTSTIGRDSDFFDRSIGANTIVYLISTCNNCLFSGESHDFKRYYTKSEKRKIEEELETIKQEVLKNESILDLNFKAPSYIILARWLERLISFRKKTNNPVNYLRWRQALKKPNMTLAKIYLRGSWCARYESEEKNAKNNLEGFCQKNATNYFKNALNNDETKNEEIVSVTYLVGELNRRLGNFDESIKYFEKAENIKRTNKKYKFGERFAELSKRQKRFAEMRDRKNKAL